MFHRTETTGATLQRSIKTARQSLCRLDIKASDALRLRALLRFNLSLLDEPGLVANAPDSQQWGDARN
jgi:hypothetical protein